MTETQPWVHALPRTCRMRRRPDFTQCYETGRRYFVRYFVLFTHVRQEGPWRIGFSVSRKAGNAVRRNRIKRVLREFFRLQGHMLPPGLDMLAVPRRDLQSVEVSLALVRADLGPLVEKIVARLLKNGDAG